MRPLPKTVKALGWTSFFTDFSTEMIYPLLPGFLTRTLGAGALALGWIEGAAESTASLLKLVSGRLSDRWGRRKGLILGGYALSGVWPLIAFAATWPVVFLLRVVNRLGKGIRTTPRDALIADWTDPRDRGAAYGFNRSLDHAGAMVGPLVAAGLIRWGHFPDRRIFGAAIVPALAAILLLFLFTRDKSNRKAPSKGAKAPSTPSWNSLGAPFRLYLGALLAFTLGNSTDAFLLLRMSDAGLGPSALLVLWSAHHAVKSLSTFWGGRWSDRVGRRVLMLSGWGLYTLVYLAFSLDLGRTGFVAVFLVYGLTYGLTEPVEKAWVADLAPKDFRGSAFGWYHLTVGLGALPASLLFGWIWKTWTPGCAFVTGACLAGGACLLLMAVPEKKTAPATRVGSRSSDGGRGRSTPR